ncbi:MAG: SAM-dependent methyltransferase [Candidatus Cloacimonetes bacterium HGW-Cloacimonetes-3]|jgi:SAM-dependent methyltransferase|nr:MAG: SAM-dependent methyltransferase [Candidatus Cloacimonetes bacterium HGW-Cloacimonetes-3]
MNHKEHYRIDAEAFDYWSAHHFTAAEKRRNQFTIKLANIRAGQKVLDIGSGRGWFSLHAASLGAEVTAMDLSATNLARIKQTDNRVNTLLADATEPLQTGQKYDLLVALEVLEHIVNPAEAVANWKAILKPKGRLLITVPYKEIIRYSLCIHCNAKTPFNAHLHSFDKDALANLLKASGLRVRSLQPFSHKLLPLLRLDVISQNLPLPIWCCLDKISRITGDKYNYLAAICSLA